MEPNATLKKLGLSDNDRAVIFHADDIGMCQATLAAYADLLEFGVFSSASTMVPCSWFPATAAYCREYEGDNLDLGVHLALNCEYRNYRWGPMSTRDPASGLMDETGYLYASPESTQAHGEPAAIRLEMQAQIKHALDAGIDVTHIDIHMGTVFHPKFVDDYLEISREGRIPPFLLRRNEEGWQRMGSDPKFATAFAKKLAEMEERGFPLFDHVRVLPLDRHKNRVDLVKQILDALPPGLTYFIFHPAKDGPEIQAITADWRSRVADFQAFTSEDLRSHVNNTGIQVLGWKALKQAVP